MPSISDNKFWKIKSLAELNESEWELLCDRCGQCCLLKLEDEDTDEIFVTNVSCHLLEIETCRCTDYLHRAKRVKICLTLKSDKPELFRYLPITCAYRCVAEGRKLPDWHPLNSKQPDSTYMSGVSVRNYAISEEFIHPDQIIDHVVGKIL